MTQPAQYTEQLRPDLRDALEEFPLQASQAGFVGLEIAPAIEVEVQAGKYGVIKLKELLQTRDTERGVGGDYNRGTGKGDFDNFATEEHGFEEPIDRREAAMYAGYWDASMIAAERSRDAVLRNHNQRVIDLVLGGVTNTTAATAVWTDSENAVPITDVSAARLAIRNRTGILPNAMCIEFEIYEKLKDCQQIIDRMKYAGFENPSRGTITTQMIAVALDLEQLIVSGGMVNSANIAQAASLTSQWDKTEALLFVKSDSTDMKAPRLANTFHWGEDGSSIGGVLEEYYDPRCRSDVIRSRMDTDEKVVYDACGERITGVAA